MKILRFAQNDDMRIGVCIILNAVKILTHKEYESKACNKGGVLNVW